MQYKLISLNGGIIRQLNLNHNESIVSSRTKTLDYLMCLTFSTRSPHSQVEEMNQKCVHVYRQFYSSLNYVCLSQCLLFKYTKHISVHKDKENITIHKLLLTWTSHECTSNFSHCTNTSITAIFCHKHTTILYWMSIILTSHGTLVYIQQHITSCHSSYPSVLNQSK